LEQLLQDEVAFNDFAYVQYYQHDNAREHERQMQELRDQIKHVAGNHKHKMTLACIRSIRAQLGQEG
jgi:hypothetical protein